MYFAFFTSAVITDQTAALSTGVPAAFFPWQWTQISSNSPVLSASHSHQWVTLYPCKLSLCGRQELGLNVHLILLSIPSTPAVTWASSAFWNIPHLIPILGEALTWSYQENQRAVTVCKPGARAVRGWLWSSSAHMPMPSTLRDCGRAPPGICPGTVASTCLTCPQQAHQRTGNECMGVRA